MSDNPHHIQSFDVRAIRDRILPDADASPQDRMRRLCQYIEADYPGWFARYAPDENLQDTYAKILMTRDFARITLYFEVLPTQSPLVVKTGASFLEYDLEVPPLPKKCLHDEAIAHGRTCLANWLSSHADVILPSPP